MKKILRTLFLVITLLWTLVITTETVYADEKSYEIESAHFYVEIKENGDATVTETWTVNYISGEYSNFYKNIYMAVPVDEEFDLKFNWIKVDGRDHGDYSLRYEDDVCTYTIHMKSEEVVREFQVNYTLEDVVKIVDGEWYLFTFRFLPRGYKPLIGDMEIEIDLPSDDLDVEVYSYSSGDLSIRGDSVTITDHYVNDMFKVSVKMTGDGFDQLPYMSRISGADVGGNNDVSTKSAVGIVVAFVLLIGGIVFGDSARTRKMRKKITQDPTAPYKIYKQWVPKYFTPAEFLYGIVRNQYLIYFVFLADLVEKNIIRFDDEFQYIYFPVNYNYHSGDREIVKILDDCRLYIEQKGMPTDNENGEWKLPVSYLETYFKNVSVYSKVSKVIKNLSTKNNVNKSQLRKDKNTLNKMLIAMAQLKRMPCVELTQVIHSYQECSLTPLFYCYQNDWADQERDASAYMTLFAVSIYSSMSSSINTGTSCSSCSSCGGGCGGCGGSN